MFMSDQRLIIFVKAPRPGEVKTRLAKDLGPEAACLAYRDLVETVVENLSSLHGVELRFTPHDGFAEVQPWLRKGWSAHPQGEGDLGARLESAFAQHFADGAERAVIIGSDCPEVLSADIEAAWSWLQTHDLVLGPATDGGYWLIGVREAQPLLWKDIAWGTGQVLEQTLHRAKVPGLRTRLLRTLTDIDTADDWRRFQAAGIRAKSPHR
jgi:rSAM/selenodomain-associated transferase 1